MGQATSKLKQRYHLQKVKLGEGAFGTVWRGVHRKTGKVVAVKQLQIERLTGSGIRDERPEIEREIQLMRSLVHENIAQIFDTFEENSSIYVVLEYCDGGDFGDKVLERGMDIQEPEVAHWVQQMCSAVTFMHSQQICHRDIKPDNFLVKGSSQLKLADLGLSTTLAPGKLLRDRCGTPAFMAPEVHGLPKGNGYGFPVDVWAVGVTMYVLMFGGRHPFLDVRGRLDERSLHAGALDFREHVSGVLGGGGFLERIFLGSAGLRMSEEARRLCQSMVTPDASQRAVASTALANSWFKMSSLTEVFKGRSPSSPSTRSLPPVHVLPLASEAASSGIPAGTGPEKVPEASHNSLKVNLVAAKGLRKSDWMGMLPGDPYCVFEIVGKPSSRVETKAVMKTLDPLWNHEVEVPVYAPGDSLLFTVWDKNFILKDRLLGKAALLPKDFNPCGFQGRLWLSDAGDGVTPTLLVKLSMNVPASKSGMDALLGSLCKTLVVTPQIQPLRVTVVGAKGLRHADWMGMVPGDPYCTCEVHGQSVSKFQTEVVSKALNPFWNHEFRVDDYVFGDSLMFTVLDKDMTKQDDLLGKVCLSSKQFLPNGFDGELPLSEAGDGTNATLTVKISPVSQKELSPAQPPATADHAEDVGGHVLWELAMREGFCPVHWECHGALEDQYQAFVTGKGPATGKVVSLGKVMLVDFRVMLQRAQGGRREWEVRRRVL